MPGSADAGSHNEDSRGLRRVRGLGDALFAERLAQYVDRILRGARPAEMPVEFPTRYELVINRSTANALGLAIPPSLALQAELMA